MTKEFDTDKTYEAAIVKAVLTPGLQQVTADEIGHIAAIATEFASSGYENGWNAAMDYKREEQKLCNQNKIASKDPKAAQGIAKEIMKELKNRVEGGALS